MLCALGVAHLFGNICGKVFSLLFGFVLLCRAPRRMYLFGTTKGHSQDYEVGSNCIVLLIVLRLWERGGFYTSFLLSLGAVLGGVKNQPILSGLLPQKVAGGARGAQILPRCHAVVCLVVQWCSPPRAGVWRVLYCDVMRTHGLGPWGPKQRKIFVDVRRTQQLRTPPRRRRPGHYTGSAQSSGETSVGGFSFGKDT